MLFKDLGRFFLRPFQKDRGLRAFVHRALYPGAKWSAGIIVVGGLLLALVFGWELTETALGYAAYLLSAYALVLLVLSLVPLARRNISTGSRNKLQNGLICLKGGDLASEVEATQGEVLEVPVTDYFKEPFFETKKIIYKPL